MCEYEIFKISLTCFNQGYDQNRENISFQKKNHFHGFKWFLTNGIPISV